LIHYWEDQRDELYNLARDEEEQNDCAAEQRKMCQQLRDRLDAYLAEVDAKKPIANPRYNAELAVKQADQMRSQRLPSLEKQHARFLDPDYVPDPTWWGSRPKGD
jgi:hypothetical protein